MRVTTAQRMRPCPGFSSSGDLVVVRRDGARLMLAVVDVLGHGPDAAEASQPESEAVAGEQEQSPDEEVVEGEFTEE